MTTPAVSNVPLPAGADETSGWLDPDHWSRLGEVRTAAWRIVYCHRHDIADLHLSVEGSGIQMADGRVDGVEEPPMVNIIASPEMFSTAAARELAAALIAVADQLDGWVSRANVSTV